MFFRDVDVVDRAWYEEEEASAAAVEIGPWIDDEMEGILEPRCSSREEHVQCDEGRTSSSSGFGQSSSMGGSVEELVARIRPPKKVVPRCPPPPHRMGMQDYGGRAKEIARMISGSGSREPNLGASLQVGSTSMRTRVCAAVYNGGPAAPLGARAPHSNSGRRGRCREREEQAGEAGATGTPADVPEQEQPLRCKTPAYSLGLNTRERARTCSLGESAKIHTDPEGNPFSSFMRSGQWGLRRSGGTGSRRVLDKDGVFVVRQFAKTGAKRQRPACGSTKDRQAASRALVQGGTRLPHPGQRVANEGGTMQCRGHDESENDSPERRGSPGDTAAANGRRIFGELRIRFPTGVGSDVASECPLGSPRGDGPSSLGWKTVYSPVNSKFSDGGSPRECHHIPSTFFAGAGSETSPTGFDEEDASEGRRSSRQAPSEAAVYATRSSGTAGVKPGTGANGGGGEDCSDAVVAPLPLRFGEIENVPEAYGAPRPRQAGAEKTGAVGAPWAGGGILMRQSDIATFREHLSLENSSAPNGRGGTTNARPATVGLLYFRNHLLGGRSAPQPGHAGRKPDDPSPGRGGARKGSRRPHSSYVRGAQRESSLGARNVGGCAVDREASDDPAGGVRQGGWEEPESDPSYTWESAGGVALSRRPASTGSVVSLPVAMTEYTCGQPDEAAREESFLVVAGESQDRDARRSSPTDSPHDRCPRVNGATATEPASPQAEGGVDRGVTGLPPRSPLGTQTSQLPVAAPVVANSPAHSTPPSQGCGPSYSPGEAAPLAVPPLAVLPSMAGHARQPSPRIEGRPLSALEMENSMMRVSLSGRGGVKGIRIPTPTAHSGTFPRRACKTRINRTAAGNRHRHPPRSASATRSGAPSGGTGKGSNTSNWESPKRLRRLSLPTETRNFAGGGRPFDAFDEAIERLRPSREVGSFSSRSFTGSFSWAGGERCGARGEEHHRDRGATVEELRKDYVFDVAGQDEDGPEQPCGQVVEYELFVKDAQERFNVDQGALGRERRMSLGTGRRPDSSPQGAVFSNTLCQTSLGGRVLSKQASNPRSRSRKKDGDGFDGSGPAAAVQGGGGTPLHAVPPAHRTERRGIPTRGVSGCVPEAV